jgi:hypothetical protein
VAAEHEFTFPCPHVCDDGAECEADVTVICTVSGSYSPATRQDPEDFPELEYARHVADCGHEVPDAEIERRIRAELQAGAERMRERYHDTVRRYARYRD